MPIGEPFIHLVEVDSTNNYAIRQAQAHLADHGTTWFANSQTGGKGQRGRVWTSQPKKNILLSCLIKPEPLSIDLQFVLSAAVALACHDLLNTFHSHDIRIKWPNDLYYRDRKAGGILIENLIHGKEWRYAILGIGLNVNQNSFPKQLHNPVSIRQMTGKQHDVVFLAKKLCICLEERWMQVREGKADMVMRDYSSHLYKLDEVVNFKHENRMFKAIVKGVNEKGELLLDTGDGRVDSFSQVEWLVEND